MLTQKRRSKALHLAKSATAILILCGMLAHTAGAYSTQLFTSGRAQTTLVELFTSQGCSSCPPAERWLGSLKDDPRLWKEIVPVAFHVDYWDYIGWQDTYAHPQYSARQRRYHAESGLRSVYTPGFVVNGQEWRGWFRKGALPLPQSISGQLQAALNDRQLQATYTPVEQAGKALTLHIALLGVGLEVDVERGENSGRRLPQDFTVLHLITLASPDGSWSATLPDLVVSGNVRPAIALWVSENGSQKPLQAAGGWLGQEG